MLRYYRHSSYIRKNCRPFINLYKNKAEARGHLVDLLEYLVENVKDLKDLEGKVPIHLSELRRAMETNTQKVLTVLQRLSDSGVGQVDIVGETVKLHIPILLELIGSKNNINKIKTRTISNINTTTINSSQHLDGVDEVCESVNTFNGEHGKSGIHSSKGVDITMIFKSPKRKSLNFDFDNNCWSAKEDYDFIEDLKDLFKDFPTVDVEKNIKSITNSIIAEPEKHYNKKTWFEWLVNCLNFHIKGFPNKQPNIDI